MGYRLSQRESRVVIKLLKPSLKGVLKGMLKGGSHPKKRKKVPKMPKMPNQTPKFALFRGLYDT